MTSAWEAAVLGAKNRKPYGAYVHEDELIRPSSYSMFQLLCEAHNAAGLDNLAHVLDIWPDLACETLQPSVRGGYAYDGIGYDVCPEDEKVPPLLVVVANTGSLEAFKLLLKYGASLNATDAASRTIKDVDRIGVITIYAARRSEEEAAAAAAAAAKEVEWAKAAAEERKTMEVAARIKAENRRDRALRERERERVAKEKYRAQRNNDRERRKAVEADLSDAQAALDTLETEVVAARVAEATANRDRDQAIQRAHDMETELVLWRSRAEAVAIRALKSAARRPETRFNAELRLESQEPFECLTLLGTATRISRTLPPESVALSIEDATYLVKLCDHDDSRVRAAAGWTLVSCIQNNAEVNGRVISAVPGCGSVLERRLLDAVADVTTAMAALVYLLSASMPTWGQPSLLCATHAAWSNPRTKLSMHFSWLACNGMYHKHLSEALGLMGHLPPWLLLEGNHVCQIPDEGLHCTVQVWPAGDEGLRRAIELTSSALQAVGIGTVESRIMCVAHYVAHSLGGDGQALLLNELTAEHVRVLLTGSGHTLVPLGSMRVGDANHRAMLFKTLADSCGTGLRVWLQRKETERGWKTWSLVEVPNDAGCVDTFVVDLTGWLGLGSLILDGTVSAESYKLCNGMRDGFGMDGVSRNSNEHQGVGAITAMSQLRLGPEMLGLGSNMRSVQAGEDGTPCVLKRMPVPTSQRALRLLLAHTRSATYLFNPWLCRCIGAFVDDNATQGGSGAVCGVLEAAADNLGSRMAQFFATKSQVVEHAKAVALSALRDASSSGHLEMKPVTREAARAWASTRHAGLDADMIIAILLDVATALLYLHEAGKPHGDVTPRNVLLVQTSVGMKAVLSSVNSRAALRGGRLECLGSAFQGISSADLGAPSFASDVFEFGTLLGWLATTDTGEACTEAAVSAATGVPQLGRMYAQCTHSDVAQRATVQWAVRLLQQLCIKQCVARCFWPSRAGGSPTSECFRLNEEAKESSEPSGSSRLLALARQSAELAAQLAGPPVVVPVAEDAFTTATKAAATSRVRQMVQDSVEQPTAKARRARILRAVRSEDSVHSDDTAEEPPQEIEVVPSAPRCGACVML